MWGLASTSRNDSRRKPCFLHSVEKIKFNCFFCPCPGSLVCGVLLLNPLSSVVHQKYVALIAALRCARRRGVPPSRPRCGRACGWPLRDVWPTRCSLFLPRSRRPAVLRSPVVKQKHHTCRNKSYKEHRQGIKKVARERYVNTKGVRSRVCSCAPKRARQRRWCPAAARCLRRCHPSCSAPAHTLLCPARPRTLRRSIARAAP